MNMGNPSRNFISASSIDYIDSEEIRAQWLTFKCNRQHIPIWLAEKLIERTMNGFVKYANFVNE